MIQAISILIIFVFLVILLSRLRERLRFIPIAIASFSVALITSGFLPGKKLIELNLKVLENSFDFKFNREFSIFFILLTIFVLVTLGSVRIVKEGNVAILERLGRYRATLEPGVNFIVPLLDSLVVEDTLREQLLDIVPQPAVTKDNVAVTIEAVIYWRILDLEKAYYAIEDVESAMTDLTMAVLRAEVGQLRLEDTFLSRELISKAVLDILDEATEPWGVKVNRVEVQEIGLPLKVQDAMEREKAEEIERGIELIKNESANERSIHSMEAEALATSKAIRIISQALPGQLSGVQILNYLLARQNIEAKNRLGESDNSKIVYMDPRISNQLYSLLDQEEAGMVEDAVHSDPEEKSNAVNDGISMPYSGNEEV